MAWTFIPAYMYCFCHFLTTGYMGWVRDPKGPVYYRPYYHCQNKSFLEPNGTSDHDKLAYWTHKVCFDNFLAPGQKCVVYDFGIRQEPHFSVALAERGCEVHGFDPSDISREGVKKGRKRQKGYEWMTRALDSPNFHFHAYGAGGKDGDMTLHNYNWGQVSVVRQIGKQYKLNKTTGKRTDEELKVKDYTVPVKTLPTILDELKHTRIAILKLDVEGSEYLFLEDALDRLGCDLPVDQITVEWHHFDYETRYGTPPHVLTLTNLLHECGFKTFAPFNAWGGIDEKGSGVLKTYALASYCRRCEGGRFD